MKATAGSIQSKSGQFVVKVKVYDTDEKKLLYEFASSSEAAKFLGLKASHVITLVRTKGINKTNNLNKPLAFR